ncbi:DNRLRE domain-containing protein [Sorangium sp. So ce448]|uniref:DNRLRE domain-containing protein n=1 Tax=Sorangium sp. So ce448 TaxID=3133314 RepID=UPI003F61EA2B
MRRISHLLPLAFLAGISGLLGCLGVADPDGLAEPAEEDVGASEEMLVARPAARLILTDSVVARLKARAAAGDAAWTALKKRCDDYTTGTMHPPNGSTYPGYPNVGQGYQGDEYPPVVRALGICYRVTTDTAAQARYGEAGVRLLEAMSTPVASGGQKPSTDQGYGIRNYVVGMAFGYDWLYPALPAATKTRLVASMNSWIDWYDESGLIKNDPIGNYFAGYYLAKTAAALATEGENAKASVYWNDVVTRMWGQLVKPKFTSMMAGGGWPEGWGYGGRAVLYMVEALWATRTATGLDWWKELPLAREQATYARYFTWPSLKHMDDQGTIRAGINMRPSAALFLGLATMLEQQGDTSAAVARGFAADVIAAAGDDSAPWSRFLYGDTAAARSGYQSTGLSHFAAGPGHVGMRSSWDSTAVWGALSGGAYINAAYSGEQMFNAGGLSVVVGDQPVLMNATGWLPQNCGNACENLVNDDSYGTSQRRLHNTFFVDDATNRYNPGQNSLSPVDSNAHVERYEDRGAFVRARATGLGDQYGSPTVKPVSQFTRDVVFFRPGSFVLFDRTTVAKASADQWMSFHTPVVPRQVTTADATQRRFDVVVGSTLVGSVRALLPKSASTTTTTLPASTARLEVHAPVRAAAQQWLTVVSAGATLGEQTRLSSADGNVIAGDVVGVELSAPQNQVVLFSADQAATGTVSSAEYLVSQTEAQHVLVDVAPSSSGYAVTAVASGGKWRIRVSAGGALQVSGASKTLSFKVSATGAVTAGSSTPPTSTPTTPSRPTEPTPTEPTPTEPTPTEPTPTEPTPSGTAQTLTFTQGVNGYTGVQDVSISSMNYSSSNPVGTVYRTNDVLLADTRRHTTKALIRFDVSQIPTTATVTAATLAVTFESWVGPQTLNGNFMKTPWSYGSATLGFSSGGAGSDWTAPGIGSGDVEGPTFQFLNIDSSGYQRRSIALDPGSVQRWVRSSAANQGLVLANSATGKDLRICSSEVANVARRPTLSVTFQ